MIKELVAMWDENSHKLKDYFIEIINESEEDDESLDIDYEHLVIKLLELVLCEEINGYTEGFDTKKLTVIDHGDYQGTKIFICPLKTYQPSIEDYIYTHNYYGSCSGCDTMEDIIHGCHSKETQLEDLMTLSLHLLQNMRWMGGEDKDNR